MALATAVVVAIYAFYDPAQNFFPRCVFKWVTGYDCPGCGSQRAVHALLTGHLAEAWHYNAMLIVAIPFVALLIVANALKNRYPRLHNALNSERVILVCGIAITLWWVGRNIFGV